MYRPRTHPAFIPYSSFTIPRSSRSIPLHPAPRRSHPALILRFLIALDNIYFSEYHAMSSNVDELMVLSSSRHLHPRPQRYSNKTTEKVITRLLPKSTHMSWYPLEQDATHGASGYEIEGAFRRCANIFYDPLDVNGIDFGRSQFNQTQTRYLFLIPTRSPFRLLALVR